MPHLAAGEFRLSTTDEEKIDPGIVAALYVEHGDQLRRFLVGVLRDQQLANDVLQITFTKLVERGHETREESRKSWLFRVAYNEAMAIRRRQAVGNKVFQRVAWTTDATHTAADVPLIRLEAVESVREAIAELPEKQQQVLQMRIYEEKTFAVIAKELGIPLGTALARMHSALAKLRKRLADN